MTNAPSASAPSLPPWEIIITDWALNSYLDHKHKGTFTDDEYKNQIRPDAELLRGGMPFTDPKFKNSKFWGPATHRGVVLPDGYKMKWHNLGNGGSQLRLPIFVIPRKFFLCEAYVKPNPATEQRKIAKFKTHMNLISQGQYVYRGKL